MTFYGEPFVPIYKPGDTLAIAGKAYKVKEVRQAFPFIYKLTNITTDTSVDLKDAGLKGKENELLQVWLKLYGACKFAIRIEGAGGPVVGGYGGAMRYADENTPANMLSFFIFEDKYGWLYLTASPIVIPAWFKLTAAGYVYYVEETMEKPVSYPPYISSPR